MNMKRLMTLALALVMVFALAACGGKGEGDGTTGNGGTTGTTAVTGPVEYSVTVQDVLGAPYTENIVVILKQNGELVAMQPVNAEGKVTKTLEAGTYEVELQITKNAESYYYASENLQVTAENRDLVITLSSVVSAEYDILTVSDAYRLAYQLVVTPASEGATEGTFVLTDINGNMSGTYNYVANDDGGYDVTDANGDDVGISINKNLDGTYAFLCGRMNMGQTMIQTSEATEVLSGTYNVESNEYIAHQIKPGCTYVELNDNERNYLIFAPMQSGVYKITIHNAEGDLGYYGGPHYVMSNNSAKETGEDYITLEIKDSMIGSGSGGTAELVIGIDVAAGVEDCIISIVRTGDVELSPLDQPWTNYHTTFVPTKYTLPEGLTLVDFDLTQSYEIVYNEADGYYHVGSADGAIVLVRLDGTLNYGGSFGTMLAGMNVGVYFYDEDGTFLRKELYNNTLHSYLGELVAGMGTYSYENGTMDTTHNVYPLTQDLMYIIQTYGEYTGWWTPGASNYLFNTLPGVNLESAWLFMCCYAQAEA